MRSNVNKLLGANKSFKKSTLHWARYSQFISVIKSRYKIFYNRSLDEFLIIVYYCWPTTKWICLITSNKYRFNSFLVSKSISFAFVKPQKFQCIISKSLHLLLSFAWECFCFAGMCFVLFTLGRVRSVGCSVCLRIGNRQQATRLEIMLPVIWHADKTI